MLTALTAAVNDLRGKGIALDVPLGQLQAEPRGTERIPIHGCTDDEGCFNIISDRPRRAGPLRPVPRLLVRDDGGVRRARAARAARRSSRYSQSENPRSPHYADQTRLFSQKKWMPMRFTERSIRRDADYKRTVVTGRR